MRSQPFRATATFLTLLSLLTVASCDRKDAESPATAPSTTASAAAHVDWLTSWEKALAESQRTGKPILADFTGSDWCVNCKQLDKEVFSTAEFKQWASENVVLLELDYPQSTPQAPELKQQNARLNKIFAIEGFPTVVVINPSGKEVGRILGFEGKTEWQNELKAIMGKVK